MIKKLKKKNKHVILDFDMLIFFCFPLPPSGFFRFVFYFCFKYQKKKVAQPGTFLFADLDFPAILSTPKVFFLICTRGEGMDMSVRV